jgi:hypothetical protein
MVYVVVRRFQSDGTFAVKAFVEGDISLTDTEIKRARGAEKPYRMADAGNLYLWITPSGGKLWRWAYRFDGSRSS